MTVSELKVTYAPSALRVDGRVPVSTPASAARLLHERLAHEAVEVAVVLLLTIKHRLIAIHELGRGTLDCCVVHPRDVLKVALLANASGVIVAHNHPSGDPTPSADDIALCARVRNAATVVGVEVLDFIIIGEGSYFSFQERGL